MSAQGFLVQKAHRLPSEEGGLAQGPRVLIFQVWPTLEAPRS